MYTIEEEIEGASDLPIQMRIIIPRNVLGTQLRKVHHVTPMTPSISLLGIQQNKGQRKDDVIGKGMLFRALILNSVQQTNKNPKENPEHTLDIEV